MEGSASVNRPLGGGVTFESTVGGEARGGRPSPQKQAILRVCRPRLQRLPRAILAGRLSSFLPAPSL